jgi:hypothetical protein
VVLAVLGWGAAPAIAASTPKISTPFVTKTNAACAEFLANFRKAGEVKFPYPSFDPLKPQPALLKKVGKYFDKGVGAWEAVPGALRSLGMPARGASTWKKIRADADRFESLAVAQARTATAGNAKGFAAEVRKLTALTKRLNSAALAGGFSSKSACATFFG